MGWEALYGGLKVNVGFNNLTPMEDALGLFGLGTVVRQQAGVTLSISIYGLFLEHEIFPPLCTTTLVKTSSQ